MRAWTVGDVGDWLEELELGQYAAAFAENLIAGRILLDVDLDDLDYMNVTILAHRKVLLRAIAELKRAGHSIGATPRGGGAATPRVLTARSSAPAAGRATTSAPPRPRPNCALVTCCSDNQSGDGGTPRSTSPTATTTRRPRRRVPAGGRGVAHGRPELGVGRARRRPRAHRGRVRRRRRGARRGRRRAGGALFSFAPTGGARLFGRLAPQAGARCSAASTTSGGAGRPKAAVAAWRTGEPVPPPAAAGGDGTASHEAGTGTGALAPSGKNVAGE